MTSVKLSTLRGRKGDKGDKGDEGVQGARGLPGVNAVPADAAVAGYVEAGGDSATGRAVGDLLAGETAPLPARFTRLAVGGHHHVPRQPVGFGITFDGSTFTADSPANKTLFPFTAVIKGGFSREAGWGALDPGFVFGQNNFITTGKVAGDIAGLNDIYGTLLEVHDFTPDSHLNYLIGAASEATLKAAGAVVENVIGHKVRGSRIRAGTATNAYGLYIDSPVTEETGVITGLRRALHVSGTADSYFGGNVLMNDRKLDAGAGAGALVRARNIVASSDPAKNAQAAITAYAVDKTGVGLIVAGAVDQEVDLQRWQDAGGVVKASIAKNGVATFALIKAGGLDNTDGAGVKVTQSTAGAAGLRVQAVANPTANLTSWLTSTNGELFGITASGAPRWTATALAQLTVGAAGGAAALPATPTKYFKVVDSAGTTLLLPAYAAS